MLKVQLLTSSAGLFGKVLSPARPGGRTVISCNKSDPVSSIISSDYLNDTDHIFHLIFCCVFLWEVNKEAFLSLLVSHTSGTVKKHNPFPRDCFME